MTIYSCPTDGTAVNFQQISEYSSTDFNEMVYLGKFQEYAIVNHNENQQCGVICDCTHPYVYLMFHVEHTNRNNDPNLCKLDLWNL